MSRPILLISNDGSTDRELRLALKKATPAYQLKSAGSRTEVEASPPPAVILLDLMLSHDPAFEVLRWLRAEQSYKHVPVFVLGSEVIDHEVSEAYALGANSCLLKHSEPEELEHLAQGIATFASLPPHTDCACCA